MRSRPEHSDAATQYEFSVDVRHQSDIATNSKQTKGKPKITACSPHNPCRRFFSSVIWLMLRARVLTTTEVGTCGRHVLPVRPRRGLALLVVCCRLWFFAMTFFPCVCHRRMFGCARFLLSIPDTHPGFRHRAGTLRSLMRVGWYTDACQSAPQRTAPLPSPSFSLVLSVMALVVMRHGRMDPRKTCVFARPPSLCTTSPSPFLVLSLPVSLSLRVSVTVVLYGGGKGGREGETKDASWNLHRAKTA